MLNQNTRPELLHVLIEEVRQNNAIQRSLIEEIRRHGANQDKLIEALQQHSTAQNNCLSQHDKRLGELKEKDSEHEHRIGELEKKYEEVMQIFNNQQILLEEFQESNDFTVREVRYLQHLVGEKEELENQLTFYRPPN